MTLERRLERLEAEAEPAPLGIGEALSRALEAARGQPPMSEEELLQLSRQLRAAMEGKR